MLGFLGFMEWVGGGVMVVVDGVDFWLIEFKWRVFLWGIIGILRCLKFGRVDILY